MADQGKWFKLWCSTLNDPHLKNLELDDFARWAKLGTLIKEQGRDGKIRFDPPYRGLLELFRLPTFESALVVLKRFPNCVLGERETTVTTVTSSTVTLEIEYTNWFKYQGDFSNDRVRKFRDKKRHAVTAQEERRGEETRGDKKRITPCAIELAEDVIKHFNTACNKTLKLTQNRRDLISRRLEDGRTIEEMKKAITNFSKDDWPDRNKYMDLVYAIGVRNKIDNLDRWLNFTGGNNAHSNRPSGGYIGAQAAVGKYATVTVNRKDTETNSDGN